MRSGQTGVGTCSRASNYVFPTPQSQGERERAEAAMIYRHKPPENTEYVDTFPYDRTTITTSGRNALLEQHFTVETSRAAVLW